MEHESEVAIAGGHGKIALLLGRLLVGQGHDVLGLIRDPGQEDDLHAVGVEPVLCDLEADDDVAAAVAGVDAVVFAAGAGPGSGAERKRTMDLGGAVKLIDAAKEEGIRRYVMVSAMGAATRRPRAATSSASTCGPRRRPTARCARAASTTRSSVPAASPTSRRAAWSSSATGSSRGEVPPRRRRRRARRRPARRRTRSAASSTWSPARRRSTTRSPPLVAVGSSSTGLRGGGAALDRVAAVAPGADALADVDDVGEALALQDRGGQAAAFAAAADRRDRAVAGQLVEALGEVAVGDVERAGDVLAGVLGGVADVEDQRRLAVRRRAPPARRGRSARSARPAAPRVRQAVIPPSRKPRTRIPTAASSSAASRSSPSEAATTIISAPGGATRETLVAKPVS